MLATTSEGDVATLSLATIAPTLLAKVEPEYTKAALDAKVEGTVTLSATIDETGTSHSVSAVKLLGFGLDEKAMECVLKWRFNPGTRNGKPVKSAAASGKPLARMDTGVGHLVLSCAQFHWLPASQDVAKLQNQAPYASEKRTRYLQTILLVLRGCEQIRSMISAEHIALESPGFGPQLHSSFGDPQTNRQDKEREVGQRPASIRMQLNLGTIAQECRPGRHYSSQISR
jgi:TonB family protein